MSRILNILPESLKEERHPLAYKWCFWQHFRPPVVSEARSSRHGDEKEKTVDNGENEVNVEEPEVKVNEQNVENSSLKDRDAQYLQETTLLSFPKVYSKTNEQTSVIDSVEQFWVALSNMKNVKDAPIDTEYFFFKEGIRPLWEDQANKKGGKISRSFARSELRSRKLAICQLWELLLLKMIGGKLLDDEISLPLSKEALDNPNFEDVECHRSMNNEDLNKLVMDDIAGLVISVRKRYVIISIWNTQLSFDRYKLENGIEETVPNVEYVLSYKEPINMKNKFVYEELGLTTHMFRKLIGDAFFETMKEVSPKPGTDNESLVFGESLVKYIPHFNANVSDLRKHKQRREKGVKNGHNDSNNTEKISDLGKIRKKIEFNNEGLLVTEINMNNTMRSKWNKRRTVNRE